tara:strand:+ start:93 stop:539 length:447 start_codon:yes stop_codon:yes gene_type:complete
MVKKSILYIFIYTLLVGCNTQNPLTNDECETDCYLEVSAPSLEMDENGYYHIEWLSGYYQTFSTLDATTGTDEIVKVMWDSDSGIYWGDDWVSSVNHASYTSDDGIAHTVVAAWEEQLNDTITVYAWYWDKCDIGYVDSIKVIVEDEI